MWNILSECVDTVTGSAGAAVISNSLAQILSAKESELCSEICCWMILPVLIRTRKPSDYAFIATSNSLRKPWSHKSPALSLWAVAVCLAATCLYKAEIGTIGLFPILTPLLLVVERNLRSGSETSQTAEVSWYLPLDNTVWGTALVALILACFLSDWNLREYALSIFPVAGLFLIYVAFVPRTDKDSLPLPILNIEQMIIPLSYRTVLILLALLGVQIVLFGFPNNIFLSSLLSGTAKALSWYCTIHTARYTSWSIAPRIATFATMSTRDPYAESSEFQCLLSVVASFLALTQVIYHCPKQAMYRPALWVFALISILPYTANMVDIRLAEFSASSSFDNCLEHPVETLINHANADYATLVQGQSSNYTAALDEYWRRYAMEPPPGFEAWYDFAVQHQSPIIDNFDIIFDTVSPFWKISGREVNAMMGDVLKSPNNELWHCIFSGEHVETQCTHPSRTNDRHIGVLFNNVLGDLHRTIPDLNLLVNHLDEPRILIPPVSLHGGKQHFKTMDMQQIPNWDAITKFCDAQKINKGSQFNHTVKLFDTPFVTDMSSAMDLCQHPEYSSMHGLFMSPVSFNLIEGLVPILSTGAPSTMGDLLFPSPAYNESGFHYDGSRDIEWERKENNLYWAGSATGGFAGNDQWRHFHRQRFVALAQNLKRQQHHYLRAEAGVVYRVASSFLNRKLYDVSFTNIIHCSRKSCRDERAYFGVKSWADKDKALQSRLVFDLDGNGISGRYYKLLASRSAPLKQTLLREWHDDRLMPWVHYVPVSQSMEELPELVLYLTSTKSGQRKAKEIADQGREWFSKAFRDVDLTIYMYRLLLELARLQDPNREAL